MGLLQSTRGSKNSFRRFVWLKFLSECAGTISSEDDKIFLQVCSSRRDSLSILQEMLDWLKLVQHDLAPERNR